MMRTQMYAEVRLYYVPHSAVENITVSVCTHTHTSVWGAWCQVGGAGAPLVLSSDRFTTGGRPTGESLTNGGRSGTSCLDNILWRVRGGSTNLSSADSDGLGDPYCVVLANKNKVKF